MSAIKTLFGVVVLAGIAGFLYVWINSDPDTTPPPGAPQAWNTPLQVELPGNGTSSPSSLGASGLSTAPPFVPSGATPPSASPPAIGVPPVAAVSPLTPPPGVAGPSASLSTAPRISSGTATSNTPAIPPAAPNLPSTSPPPAVTVPVSNTPPSAAGAAASPSVTPVAPLAATAGQSASTTDIAASKDNPLLPSDAKRAENPQPDRPAAASASTSESPAEFEVFMRAVQDALAEDHLAQAHSRLSTRYRDPRLSPEQARRVQDLLDQLAGTVIYSQRSLLDPPYRVQPGDTLETIATQCNVPSRFLAKVNGLRDSRDVQPGRELKVVRGPFDAVVRLESHELTLILGGRYAGRFAIGIGKDCPMQEGSYTVRSKTVQPAYYSPDNRVVEPGSPQNPLGRYLIGLDQQLSIHGTNDPSQIGRNSGQGCISLGDRDIEDLYTILSVGSRVVIQR